MRIMPQLDFRLRFSRHCQHKHDFHRIMKTSEEYEKEIEELKRNLAKTKAALIKALEELVKEMRGNK